MFDDTNGNTWHPRCLARMIKDYSFGEFVLRKGTILMLLEMNLMAHCEPIDCGCFKVKFLAPGKVVDFSITAPYLNHHMEIVSNGHS